MSIVITGENGYIAKNMKCYFENARLQSIKELKDYSFLENAEVVIHLAAIVHKKETMENESSYYKINTELTFNLAKRAKEAGVKHFIFFSSMAVYGKSEGEINELTEVQPTTHYGKSKVMAEQQILTLQDSNFRVAIIRPPVVYGANCPGNYTRLRNGILKIPFFPDISNKRSMIYIGNLIAFTEEIIKFEDTGIFHPQDPELINIKDMVCNIARFNNKHVCITNLGSYLLKFSIGRTKIYKKIFGDLYYKKSLSDYRENKYQKFTVEIAIKLTEKGFV